MVSNHQINLIQKYLLEKDGYFEYYKIEYAKICKLDAVTECYQTTTNYLTDGIRQGGVEEENVTDIFLVNRASVIASTDIIEYFRRRKIPLVMLRFLELVNQGIGNLHELINEFRFPRMGGLGN
jgi:hypothetical protein